MGHGWRRRGERARGFALALWKSEGREGLGALWALALLQTKCMGRGRGSTKHRTTAYKLGAHTVRLHDHKHYQGSAVFGSTATIVNKTDKDLCSQEASLPLGEIGRKQYTGPRVEKKSGRDEGKEEPGDNREGAARGACGMRGNFKQGGSV